MRRISLFFCNLILLRAWNWFRIGILSRQWQHFSPFFVSVCVGIDHFNEILSNPKKSFSIPRKKTNWVTAFSVLICETWSLDFWYVSRIIISPGIEIKFQNFIILFGRKINSYRVALLCSFGCDVFFGEKNSKRLHIAGNF